MGLDIPFLEAGLTQKAPEPPGNRSGGCSTSPPPLRPTGPISVLVLHPERAVELAVSPLGSVALLKQRGPRRTCKLICVCATMATYLSISNAMSPEGQDLKNCFTLVP